MKELFYIFWEGLLVVVLTGGAEGWSLCKHPFERQSDFPEHSAAPHAELLGEARGAEHDAEGGSAQRIPPEQGVADPILEISQPTNSSRENYSEKATGGFPEEKTDRSPNAMGEDESGRKNSQAKDIGKYSKNGEHRGEERALLAEQNSPAKPLLPSSLGPEWKNLAEKVRQTLHLARQLPVNTQQFTPADLMQWALLWGCEAEAAYGGPAGQRVNVLAILCHNYPCAERRLLVEHQGHVAARFGYGYQTHRGEFLAVLAWARVPKDYPLQVGQAKPCVADLVQYEKLHCRSGLEQSHVLMGLSFYLETQEETSWQNSLGESWSLERLVSEELRSPIQQGADGGLHRLLALSYAVQCRRKHNLPWTPLFDQVAQYVGQWQRYALGRQNADGSWDPSVWDGAGGGQDRLGVLRLTGLVFRWLAFSLPEEELHNNQMFKSTQFLLQLLHTGGYLRSRTRSPKEFSSLVYALDGLRLYQERALAPSTLPISSP